MNQRIKALLIMLLAFTTHWVQAQDVAKIGSTGFETLADAVAAADVGATIEVVAAGNYTLPNLPKNVTIKGNADGVVSFTHTTAGSVASVPNGATFKNVKFIWGNVDYHGFQHAGTINMEGCTLDGKLFSYGDMNFTNCSFTQSNADYHMWAYSGNVTYTGCTFTNSSKGKFINVYNESGTTKYTVTATNCTFINNASSSKAALNVKATCGSNVLAYDVIINNCSTEGSFPEASSSDALVVLNSLVQVDDRTASGVDNITVTQDGVLIYPVVVAQIGSTGYATLQAAVDAAQQMGGAQTINIVDNISGETVTIQEVANFKLTIDGNNKTVDALIIVDGLRANGGSTTNGASVTLQNIAFVKTTATDGIQASHYPHHVTIQDCTYSGSDNDKWFFNASDDGPLYGVTIKDVTVEHARLIYGNLADDAVFQNITATNDVKVGFNVKTSGTALIENCEVTTGKYAFRDYSDGYVGTFTLKDNTFVSTSEDSDEGVIVNRGGVVGTTHINVESGTYTGHIKVLNNKEGVLAITGDYFSEEFPQEYISADLVAQGKVCVPAPDKEGYFTVGDPHYVAQIGETGYVTLQAALDAAHEMTGDVTIELLDNISGYSIVHQKAGLNLTIDGKSKTLEGQIIVIGDGRLNGAETLTIQNIQFNDNTSNFYTGTDAFVLVPSTKTSGTPFYNPSYNNHAHNITISGCTFTGDYPTSNVVAFKSNSGTDGTKNLTMENVTATNLHSLAQLTAVTDATFDNCSATQTGSFIGANGGGGSYIVKDCTFESHPDKADGYAYREKSSSTAVATLTNNNFTAHDAIILGSAGTVNVESGIYTGAVSKTAGTIAISGGYFSEEFPQEYIAADLAAQGQICIPATDKEGYFTVGYHYVAQIGETKFASLAAAVAAAQANDVITMIDDDNVSLTAAGSEITIDKPLTITGAVDENGKPKFTIFGSTNGALNNNSFNDLFLSCSTGTVTISNLKFDGFGNEISSVMGHSPVFIGSRNQNAVIENVYISNLNCEGIHINGGSFTIKDCNIDCSKTSTSIFTKGICVVNDAQGSIENTTITGVDCDDPNDTSAAIELQGSGDIAISGCTIQTNTIGIATTPVADLTAGTSQVTISDCTIESQNIAVYSNGDKGALTSISSGRYSGLLMAGDNDEGLSISGGLFDDMPEQAYCAEGYAPADNTDAATKDAYPYTVLELPDVAQIGDVKFKSLAAAVAAVPAGTETTITMIANEMIDVVGYAITIPANKNVVLDLNGFEVVGTASEGNTSALITNRGTLTIMDSSDTNKDGTGTGKLMSGASTTWTWDGSDDYSGSYASNLIRNEKDLIVESGYLYNMSTGSAAYGIDNYNAGNVTINGGKVDAAKASAIRMFYINGGSVSVTDGVIGHYVSDSDCTYMGIQVMGGTNVNVTITGGSISGNYAFYANNTGGKIDISDGAFDGYVAFGSDGPSDISISGGSFNVWVGTWGEQTKFISGGIYAEEVDEEYIADGYILTDNTDEATKEDYPYTVRTGLYVAQIGTTKYESLADAIDAVGDGETIKMIADVDNATGLSVLSGKNFTVDFDGHTYTLNKPGAGSTGTETIGFQLLMNSTIVFKNGTINISEDNLTPAVAPAKNIKRIIQNYANLTLEDMTIDGTNQFGGKTLVVSFNNGTSNIIGNTSITAGETGVSPIMDVYLNSSYTGTNVTINTTGVIGGDIETCCNVSQEKADACSLTITNADVLGTIVNNGTYDIPVSVSGGIYDEEVLEEFCAEGYVCVPTDDGRFTVMTKEDAGIFDLVDWENYPYTEEKQATQLTYSRRFNPSSNGTSRVGKYQPWIVPFDYEISEEDAENFQFYKINLIASSKQEGEVSNDQQIYINVLKVYAGYVLKANRPYIVVPLHEFSEEPYVFKTQNVTLKVPDTETSQLHTETARLAFDFYANYKITKFGNIRNETNKNFCLSTSGTLMWLKPSTSINGYRWYAHVTDKYGDSGDDYSNWTFVIGEDDPTGIYTFTGVDPNEIEGIYTPSGMKVETPVKGINIIKFTNGTTKKVYIK